MDQSSIRLGGTLLGSDWHVCGFFHTRDDEYRLLLPFIKEGFEGGEKAVHIVDPQRRDDHVSRLRSVQIDVEAALESGQLDLRDWSDAHLRGGSFSQDRTLELIGDIKARSLQEGYRRIRFVTHMEWALEALPGVEGLLEYEASANLEASEDPVVCVYDLSRFGGDVMVDVMRTHPVVIVGGLIQENPFYVPPAEFIREARERVSRTRERSRPVS
jgi:hypothetical protein